MIPIRIAASIAVTASLSALALEPVAVSPGGGILYLAPAPWMDPLTIPSYSPPVAKAVVATPAIDTGSRPAVKAAYNTYYNLGMPAVGWTGSVQGCVPGSISLAFQEWTISRINFLRAMAGVSGNTTLDSTRSASEQAAALIMEANNTLTHAPTPNMTCYSQAGYDGASSSNLAYGTPNVGDSIGIYMSEPGAGNQVLGHRRWILYSAKGKFGLGQTNAASALWAFDSSGTGGAPNGIPWPPRGWVPLDLFPTLFTSTQRWSFGLPGADFLSASVTVLLNGAPVSVNVVSRTDNGYGDNTIVWEMPAGHTVVKGSAYDVAISGIGGASASSVAYQVRPFDSADPAVAVRTDLNGDAKSDILWRNASTGQVFRQLLNGLTISSGATVYAEPSVAWKIVGDADFTGDGISDLLYRNDVTGQVVLLAFNGAGVPVSSGLIYTEPNAAWKIVATPDINGDGRADIVWWNSDTGQVFVMLMNGYSTVAQGIVYTEPNTNWKIVTTGDFAGSGKQNQFVWRQATTGQVFLMTLNYSGAFSQSGVTIYTEPNLAWKIVGAADFNGDGKSDLLWRNDATGQVFGMLMNGASIASSATFYTEPNLAWKVVAQGDYNGDGRADVLWRNDLTGQVYIMLMNGLAIASSGLVYTEPSPAWRLLGTTEYAQ